MRVKHTTTSSISNISMVIMIVILILLCIVPKDFVCLVVGRERTIMRGDEAQNRYTW
jgi:hypothetical protein